MWNAEFHLRLTADSWQAQWAELICTLLTPSQTKIRNASKFAVDHVAEAGEIFGVTNIQPLFKITTVVGGGGGVCSAGDSHVYLHRRLPTHFLGEKVLCLRRW
jgi:hypothetical protein